MIINNSSLLEATRLQVTGLCFSYPPVKLFSDFSAHIGPGLTLVRGGDGSGKTTLLRLLAGVSAAQAGNLTLNGVRLQASPKAYQDLVFWADPHSTALEGVSPWCPWLISSEDVPPGVRLLLLLLLMPWVRLMLPSGV